MNQPLETNKSFTVNHTGRISLRHRISVEWSTWASLAFVGALLEGGVLGVIIKNGFVNQVNDWTLNLSVAIATGAPYFSNLLSFYWVKWSRGRSKARMVSNLAVLFCLCTLSMSVVPFNEMGLIIFLAVTIVARVAWSGILTVRSNIWRANYPRHIRGKVTAKLATLASLVMAISGILVGLILDWKFDAFRWLFVVFSFISVIGAYRYRYLAVRNQQKEIVRESKSDSGPSFASMFGLLRRNRAFGKYMLAMFILGSGNLMFTAPLIVFLNEHTGLQQLQQILITTAIPLALIPLAVRWWAKLLDGNHIFHFRSIHSWGFVFALATFLLAQITGYTFLFYIGSVIYGIAISGGVIGWNLGHNDFVSNNSDGQSENQNPMDYMAVHVTLTGLRGLIMPLVGIALYQWLEQQELGLGKYALALPLTMTTIGGSLFVLFNRQHRQSQ
ncbi:MAG: MFS transporter [Kangiellaceae bacterium]|nr:MFS transporter [Kangiellaceae bacterium]